MHVCMYVFMYVCIYVCMYVCMCVCHVMSCLVMSCHVCMHVCIYLLCIFVCIWLDKLRHNNYTHFKYICMYSYFCIIKHIFNHLQILRTSKQFSIIFRLGDILDKQNIRFMELLDVSVANLIVVPAILMFGCFDHEKQWKAWVKIKAHISKQAAGLIVTQPANTTSNRKQPY